MGLLVGCDPAPDASGTAARPPAVAGGPPAEEPVRDADGAILAGLPDFKSGWDELDDPETDGWTTEALTAAADAKLKTLGRWLTSREGDLGGIFLAESEYAPVVDEAVAVRTGAPFVVTRRSPGPPRRCTLAELERALPGNWPWLESATDAGIHFKIHDIRLTGGGTALDTRVLVSVRAAASHQRHDGHADWRIRWRVGAPDDPLRIEALAVTRWESSRSETDGGALFADLTESVLGQADCYRPQLLRGLNHWLERLPILLPTTMFGTPGIALGDVDGDGREDLFLCQEDGLPNRLFLQRPDGTAVEVSQAWGVDWIDGSRSALLVDLDNDGDQDLAVAVLGNIVVACNEEGSRFEVRAVLPTSESLMSMCAADYDGDGRLDLYACAYDPDELLQEKEGQLAVSAGPFVYYDSNNGPPNSLFRNLVDADAWRFEDATKAAGLDANNRRWSYAASWADYDNDGDPDLYVANDFGRNNLYRNEGGRFVDVAGDVGAEDSASGMSVAWGDYDRDGFLDLHVGNMWSSAGRRIVAQEQFKPEIAPALRGTFLRFARGNTLLRNVGGGRFEDESEASGITMGRWAWSSPMVDIDNDGWEDLVVANGYITGTGQDGGDL